MRISDGMRYRLLQANIGKIAQQLDSIQTKIATQKEINAPSDDPIKFATAIQYDAERSIGAQYNDTLTRLGTFVGMYNTAFSSISGQLGSLTNLANTYGTMDKGLRDAAGEQIQATIEQLVTVGNMKIGSTYIFGGQQANAAPFQLNSDYSVTYNVSRQAEDATSVYVDKGQLGQFGVSGREAFYGTEKVAFGSVSNLYTGEVYSNTDRFVYVVDDSAGTGNNTITVNGETVALTAGVYTGAGLARELQKQLQQQLGHDVTVAFDSTSRKFLITNRVGGDITFNWSDSASTAANLLGFDHVDSILKAGGTEKSDSDTGRKAFLVRTATAGSTSGALGSRATYRYSVDGGATWSEQITVNTGGADSTADIIIDDANHTILLNGAAVTLANGTYTGSSLADEIQAKLGAGFTVSHNADTRKFSITNTTGNLATLNWSNAGATAGGVLGFDNVDSVVSNGSSDTSDYVAGMFIDGRGVATTANNGIKLLFGTAGNLVAGATPDTFQIKDLSVFELLKNLKDAFDSGNAVWITQNSELLEMASDLTSKNNAVVAFQGTQASTLISSNKTKDAQLESMKSGLIDANVTDLAMEFNSLLNTYQALLATLSKMQSISILDYLKL